jgi:hypothetical protein
VRLLLVLSVDVLPKSFAAGGPPALDRSPLGEL